MRGKQISRRDFGFFFDGIYQTVWHAALLSNSKVGNVAQYTQSFVFFLREKKKSRTLALTAIALCVRQV